MRQTKRHLSLFMTICIFSGVVLGANMIAMLSMELVSPLMYPHEYEDYISNILRYDDLLIRALSFLVPTIISIIYLLPIYQTINKKDINYFHPIAKKRLLTSPLILGLVGLIGWGMAFLGYFYRVYKHYLPLLIEPAIKFLIGMFLTGSICFVVIYFLLEFINRKHFIPFFFPKGKLEECEGTIVLSIKTRFFIYFFAVAVFSVFIFYNIIIAVSIDKVQIEDILVYVTILMGVLFAFGIFLTYIISRSYQKPLIEMKNITSEIKKGNYKTRIQVVSNDEVGNLGESINEMAIGLKEKEFIKDTFGKAVDPRVRDHLLKGNIEMGGSLCESTILFTDIRGFTPMSEKYSPQIVVHLLNQFFEQMSSCIEKEGGLVNKYIGDAILAVFGAPIELKNHADAAIRAAFAMLEERDRLNKQLESQGYPVIKSGIGIHSGEVLAGNIGSQKRMEYTVTGDVVNVAARVEKLCKHARRDLLITEATIKKLIESYDLKAFTKARVRGKSESIVLYSN